MVKSGGGSGVAVGVPLGSGVGVWVAVSGIAVCVAVWLGVRLGLTVADGGIGVAAAGGLCVGAGIGPGRHAEKNRKSPKARDNEVRERRPRTAFLVKPSPEICLSPFLKLDCARIY